MGALTSLATIGLNAAFAERRARDERRQIAAERDRQIAEIRARDADLEAERRAALRRMLATQRARSGAAGVGSAGGSADAVLRGLTEESERERTAREGASARRIDALRDRARSQHSRNLLDLSEQLTGSGLSLLGGGRRRTVGRSLLDP